MAAAGHAFPCVSSISAVDRKVKNLVADPYVGGVTVKNEAHVSDQCRLGELPCFSERESHGVAELLCCLLCAAMLANTVAEPACVPDVVARPVRSCFRCRGGCDLILPRRSGGLGCTCVHDHGINRPEARRSVKTRMQQDIREQA